MRITKPTLLLDENKCLNNLSTMYTKAVAGKVDFRPHFKTHLSAEIGDWFKQKGITKITVSSIGMARYFAKHGWNDILIAFPFNILEGKSINELVLVSKLSLTVESVDTVKYLTSHIDRELHLYIKIDAGYHRTGLSPENTSEISYILNEIKQSKNLKFVGFLSHYGNTYSATNNAEIRTIYIDSTHLLQGLKEKYLPQYPELILSIGDTPSCSIIEDFHEVDEIRPGNFIFYDLMQFQLGTCTLDDIAVVLACPVTALHPERNEIVIYGGGVHLSKEFIVDAENIKSFGKVVGIKNNGWSIPLKSTFVSSVSQEHGIIKSTPEIIKNIKIGDILGIVPIHSCMTANLAYSYLTINNQIIDKMRS